MENYFCNSHHWQMSKVFENGTNAASFCWMKAHLSRLCGYIQLPGCSECINYRQNSKLAANWQTSLQMLLQLSVRIANELFQSY